MIIFTKTSTTTGRVNSFIEFTNEKKGLTHFREVTNELGYDNESCNENLVVKKYQAGGRGHDFTIELEITRY
jgi:hypothetical protein